MLWLCLVLLSSYFTTTICLSQWERYASNPISVQLDSNHRQWMYGPIGITLCTKFVDDSAVKKLVRRFWNITSDTDSVRFNYYASFLHVIANTDSGNLTAFKPFANDTSLDRIDMQYVAWQVDFLPKREYSF